MPLKFLIFAGLLNIGSTPLNEHFIMIIKTLQFVFWSFTVTIISEYQVGIGESKSQRTRTEEIICCVHGTTKYIQQLNYIQLQSSNGIVCTTKSAYKKGKQLLLQPQMTINSTFSAKVILTNTKSSHGKNLKKNQLVNNLRSSGKHFYRLQFFIL